MGQVISTLYKLKEHSIQDFLGIILTNQKTFWEFLNYIFALFKRIKKIGLVYIFYLKIHIPVIALKHI